MAREDEVVVYEGIEVEDISMPNEADIDDVSMLTLTDFLAVYEETPRVLIKSLLEYGSISLF